MKTYLRFGSKMIFFKKFIFSVKFVLALIFFLFIGLQLCDAQISRDQVISNSNAYIIQQWTATSSNIKSGVSCGGKTIQTPSWVKVGTNTAMPYCWGGWTTTGTIQGYLNSGKSAGDNNTATSFGVEPSCAVGLDCSGFVSRVWGLSSKYSTSTLPNISKIINLSNVQPGDILNDAGSHVRLVEINFGNGNYQVVEASGRDWKVSRYTYSAAQLTGYIPRQYNNITGDILSGFASVSSGVSISPSTVVSGNDFTTSFTLKETKGASITFESIVCAITNSSGTSVRDMEMKGPITISASGTYNYTSTLQWRTTDATGTYKAVARGKVAGGNWFDFTTAGGVNPKDFQVIQSSTASISSISFPVSVNKGSSFNINYTISATGSMNVLLGASIKSSVYYDDASNDISVSLVSGSNSKSRTFNLSIANPPVGVYDVVAALYSDKNNSGKIDAGDVLIGNYFTSSQKLTITSVCTAPTSPTSATASQTTITSGQSTTLQVQGGALNDAPNWVWYTGGCGGTQIGTGTTKTVTPTSTTTYYVQASACGSSTTCRSVTINVNAACTAPVSPTSATASQTTITSGQSTNLQVNGGTLNSASNWIWYTGSCGGAQAGTGTTLMVYPTSTTTYYVQASACGSSTTCRSVTINVSSACTAPVSPTSATASQTTIASGQSTTLQVNGGTLNDAPNWNWYTGSCGGTPVGTGTTLSVSPTATTIYYVQASACTSSTTCRSVTINVAACTPVSMATQPNNQTVNAGNAASFSVSVNGTAPYSYFWYKNGSFLTSTTNSSSSSNTYTTPTLATSNSGEYYYCLITNCNSTYQAQSDNAILSVNASDCAPPLAPATCITSIGDPANGLEHILDIYCDNVLGAEGYSFEYSTDAINWNINWVQGADEFIAGNPGDQPNIARYYRVRAFKCDPVLYSNYTYASPQPIYTACDDPAVPTVNGATSSSVNVSLNAEIPVENPTYTNYSIYCETTNQYVQSNGSLGTNAVFQTKSTWGTKTVTGLTGSTQYCFYAKAKNNDGDIRFDAINLACGSTLQGTAIPSAPIATAATNITKLSFSANWNTSPSASKYFLDVSLNNSFSSFVAGYNNKDVGNVTTASVSGLSANTTYYYRVSANNSTGTSGVSNTINVTLSDIPTATLLIVSVSGSAGNSVSIPVTAIKLSDAVGFQFTITYDKTKLTYTNCTNWGGGTNASGVQITPLDGKLTFVYSDVAINITSGKLFDLNFAINSTATGSADLAWSDTPTLREISNSQGSEIPCSYTNGSVSILAGFSLTGMLIYENTTQTPLNNISVSLLNSSSQPVATSLTDVLGSFSFPGLSNGNYSLNPAITIPWGGATAMDITSYKKHIGNAITLTPHQVKSGDVNGSNSLTSIDLTIIKQRIGAVISAFTVGDWIFDQTSATINGANLNQNIKAYCYGDANGSYLPNTQKSSSIVFLPGTEQVKLLGNSEFEVPFTVSKPVSKLSSVTLIINYPEELFEIKNVQMIANNEDLFYTVKDGTIRVIYSTLNSLELKENDLLMTIRFSLKKDAGLAALQDNQLDFSGSGEFGDYDDNILDGVKLYFATANYKTLTNDYKNLEVAVYPNPARNILTITNVEDSKIEIYDMLGRNVMIVDSKTNPFVLDIRKLLTGTYTLKINKNNVLIYKVFTVIK